MSHDPRHIKEANRRLAQARAERAAQRAVFETQCREHLPQLAKLDRAIRATVARAIAAALQQGTDPARAVEEARRENLSLQAQRLELLRDAGIDPQQLEETPLCPICGDTGWHDGAMCQCVAETCAKVNLEELGGQLDLEALTFEHFDLDWYTPGHDRESMASVLAVCRDYAAAFPGHTLRNLYLCGGTGLGKTMLSGCIAADVARRGYWTVYATAGELLNRYEAVKFGRDDTGSAQEELRRYENCDLLVLDDLGSEMTTPFVQSALYQLLNQRMLAGRHMVISSNLDMDAVRSRYTPQVASRLEGEFQELPFFGADIRLKRKEKALGLV